MAGESAAGPAEEVPAGSTLTRTGAPGAFGKLPSSAGAPRSTTKTPVVVKAVPPHCVLLDVNATHRPSLDNAACELSSPATPLLVFWNFEISLVVPATVSRT